jgi:hypothetical protein
MCPSDRVRGLFEEELAVWLAAFERAGLLSPDEPEQPSGDSTGTQHVEAVPEAMAGEDNAW